MTAEMVETGEARSGEATERWELKLTLERPLVASRRGTSVDSMMSAVEVKIHEGELVVCHLRLKKNIFKSESIEFLVDLIYLKCSSQSSQSRV